MPAVQVPDGVATNVRARWPARGELWLASAAADVLSVCVRYSAAPVRVFPARFALVIAATAPGRSFVIRSTADPCGPQQAAAAKVLAELGIAPQVHEVMTSAAGTCVVMDEVQPGMPAVSCTAGEIADLLRPLIEHPASVAELPPISAWLRQRLNCEDMGPDVDAGAIDPTDAERSNALTLLDALEGQEASAVCHGDVSLGNVLRGRDRLHLIDPRGMTGDVEYDAAVVAIKAQLDANDLARRLHIDGSRVDAWVAIALAARV